MAEACRGFDEALVKAADAKKLLPARTQVKVWLSGSLCQPFLLPKITGLESEEELRKIAGLMAEDLTGLPGPCKVWIDTVQREPSLAVAMSESTQKLLEETIGRGRMRSLQPWWSEVLRQHVKSLGTAAAQDQALVVKDCDSLTVLLARADTFLNVQTHSPVVGESQTLIDRTLFGANWPTESFAQVGLAVLKDMQVGGSYLYPTNQAVFSARSPS